MIEIKNLDQVIRQIDAWEVAVQQLVVDVARGLSIELFKTAVVSSPQYSGDFAANWKYSINSIDTSFESGLFTVLSAENVVRHWQGEAEAVNYAYRANTAKPAALKLGDTVFLCNSAAHDEEYAMPLWEGKIKLRPQNPQQVAERVQDMFARYAVIDAATAMALRKVRMV